MIRGIAKAIGSEADAHENLAVMKLGCMHVRPVKILIGAHVKLSAMERISYDACCVGDLKLYVMVMI